MKERIEKYSFLFEELVKRDFKKKYKRTSLGMVWSMLHPLLTLTIMTVVFKEFFGKETPNYTIYVFCGTIIFSYFKEATTGGMLSLVENAGIFSKVKLPKYMFLLTKNISSLINFSLTLILLFVFILIDGISITPAFLMLLYPIFFLMLFNIGFGLILSALYVFFRDMHYIYDIFTLLLMYVSAIFYTTSSYAGNFGKLFYLNPVYCYIDYFRTIIIAGEIPSLALHGLCAFYAIFSIIVGYTIYIKKNQSFMYYL